MLGGVRCQLAMPEMVLPAEQTGNATNDDDDDVGSERRNGHHGVRIEMDDEEAASENEIVWSKTKNIIPLFAL
jgi:hypothetical protein